MFNFIKNNFFLSEIKGKFRKNSKSCSISKSKERIVICGQGNEYIFFKKIVLDMFGITPLAIIDQKNDFMVKDNTVHTNLENNFIDTIPRNSIVILTVGNQKDREFLRKKLIKKGFNSIKFCRDYYEYQLIYGGKLFYYFSNFIFRINLFKIEKAFGLLGDKESKSVFKSFVATHYNRTTQQFYSHSYNNQYFPFDIFDKKDYLNFIQLGAYDGDTLINLNNKIGKIESILAFEPDAKNFSKLGQTVKKINFGTKNVILANKAVSNFNGKINFSSEGSPTSRFVKSKNTNSGDVDVTRLDDFEINQSPDMIVIDIEGQELNAIDGMLRILRRYKPNLAIATYHYPDHIYKIILRLWAINPNYKFYLRNYSGCTLDTVLYAKSTEKD
jgi:FkbM family methyltransferase